MGEGGDLRVRFADVKRCSAELTVGPIWKVSVPICRSLILKENLQSWRESLSAIHRPYSIDLADIVICRVDSPLEGGSGEVSRAMPDCPKPLFQAQSRCKGGDQSRGDMSTVQWYERWTWRRGK